MTPLEINKRIAKIKYPDHPYDTCAWCNSSAVYTKLNPHISDYAGNIRDAWELFEEIGKEMDSSAIFMNKS